MRRTLILTAFLLLGGACSEGAFSEGAFSEKGAFSDETRAFSDEKGLSQEEEQQSQKLAQCLSERGWIMYGSDLCSACRAQRKAFGDAFAKVKEIECKPSVDGAQTELCMTRKVRKFPTWIREQNGVEVDRVEEFQRLDDLAALAGCH